MSERVLFACVHNAGRSQMAAALFNRLANPAKAQAVSAGTRPGSDVHPEVREAMQELGIDLSAARPQRLTADVARGVRMIITMGCAEECPHVPGAERDDWALPDPKGRTLEEVRVIRDDIRARVTALVQSRGWGTVAPRRALSAVRCPLSAQGASRCLNTSPHASPSSTAS